jgi:hypothetical protein
MKIQNITRKRIVISAVVLISTVSLYTLYAVSQFKSYSTPALSRRQIVDSIEAQKRNIKGYIEITPQKTDLKSIYPERETEYRVNLNIKFVSHTKELTETEILIDPHHKYATTVEKYLGDNKGSVLLNDYISYDPSGSITLKAGEPITVTLSINLPKDFPKVKIPLNGVGIISELPVIDYLDVDIYG